MIQLSCLKSFYNADVFKYLAVEANHFAKEFLDENVLNLPKYFHALKWFHTNAKEPKVFVRLLILQSVNSKSMNAMYFSKRKSIATPFFQKLCQIVDLICYKSFCILLIYFKN